MPQPISNRMIEKAILKGAKKVIAASGLNPSTRSGNKELSHWATSLSKQTFPSIESAEQYGEGLGQKIVARSQTLNRHHLDGGTIRQLRSAKDLPTMVETPVVATSAIASRSTTSPSTPAVSTSTVSEPVTAPTSTEVNMSEVTKSEPEIVSIPVEKPESTQESATVGSVEDEDVIPADPEAAKVDIDPEPEISTAAEEPKSAAETVAQKEAIADATGEDVDVLDLAEAENENSSAVV